MKRLLMVFPIAVLIALILFSFMVWMVGVGKQIPPEPESILRFDIVMVENEPVTQRRQRELPKPPQKPQTAPTEALTQNTMQNQALMTQMPDLPDFSMDTSVTGMEMAIPQASSIVQNQQVMPLHRIEPRYPARALQRKIEGYVVMSFTIDAQGKPTDIKVLEAQPARIFNREAVTALKRWKYSPRVVNGVATPREGQTVKLEFRIQQ